MIGDTWLFSGAIIERDLGHLRTETRSKVVRESVAALYNRPVPEPMPAPSEYDESMKEWCAERDGYYVGIS